MLWTGLNELMFTIVRFTINSPFLKVFPQPTPDLRIVEQTKGCATPVFVFTVVYFVAFYHTFQVSQQLGIDRCWPFAALQIGSAAQSFTAASVFIHTMCHKVQYGFGLSSRKTVVRVAQRNKACSLGVVCFVWASTNYTIRLTCGALSWFD